MKQVPSEKNKLWVSILDFSALEGLGRYRKIVLPLRKENAFSHLHNTWIWTSKMQTREINSYYLAKEEEAKFRP